MTDLGIVLEQLKAERTKIDRAIAALIGVVGGKSTNSGARKVRTLSPAARRRIAAAQKARWAKFRAKKAA